MEQERPGSRQNYAQKTAVLCLKSHPLLQGDAPASLVQWQARLFGVSGLLPPDVSRSPGGADDYLRQVWDLWWRERDQFSEVILPAAVWRLHGLRPANHPLRRLALAAHWWAEGNLPARLDRWFTAHIEDQHLPSTLLEALQTSEDHFWSWHWTLRGRRLTAPQPLVGPARIADLAVNVFLPWFWVRARQGHNATLEAEAERRFLAWPPAQDNSVLRLARERLLGGVSPWRWRGAAHQQGLLQIVRDFCEHSDPLCSDCPFPEGLGELRATAA